VRVLLNEPAVEHFRITRRGLEHGLGDPSQQRQIAADPRLHVHRADLGRVEGRHIDELVRDDRPPRRRFDQRVDVDERRAAPVGLGQPGEHPRRVRGGVVADQEDRVCLLPVAQVDRPLAGPDCRRQGTSARLVAHVRAVREVVRPELAHPQLVEERRLVAEPPEGVKGRVVRAIEPAQSAPEQLEGLLPRDRPIPVARRVIRHRLSLTPLRLQAVVTPAGQLAHRVRREELTADLLARQLPSDVLDAVLANV
jgi:hypothetical protein